MTSNTIQSNVYGDFGVGGEELSDFIQGIDTSNTIDGKPIYYWVDKQDQQVPSDAGYVGIVNCTNITVKNLTLVNKGNKVLFAYTNDSIIENINASDNNLDICFIHSFHNTITRNTINSICLCRSSNNNIYLNNFIDAKISFPPIESTNIWHSPEPITYTYNGNIYTNYLGN